MDIKVATQEHLDWAIDEALAGRSKLTPQQFALDGMSSRLGRATLNNLCSVPGVRYLEVGLFRGATFCSAIYSNAVVACGVDNWSQFGGPKTDCLANIDAHIGANKVSIVDVDCFSGPLLPWSGNYNVYFYDGDHTLASQTYAFSKMHQYLADQAIVIVDDWSDHRAFEGTRCGLELAGLTPVYTRTMRTQKDPALEWWSDMQFMVVKKGL